MRPLFGETPPARPRASDNGGPTTFFIGEEDAVDAALQQSLSSFTALREPRKQQQPPPPPPQKQPGAECAEAGPSSVPKHSAPRDRDSSVSASSSPHDNDEHLDDASLSSDHVAPVHKPTLAAAGTEALRPITPSSGPASAISGISSRRNSVAASLSEEVASQALSMSVDLEPEMPASMMDSGSAPQLIMPSIKMPSRRPFTEEGKRMGRLKVLVAGDSGK